MEFPIKDAQELRVKEQSIKSIGLTAKKFGAKIMKRGGLIINGDSN